MNDFDFSFEATPWEEYLETLTDTASAMTFLTLLEEEEEDVFEEALQELEARSIELDLSDLPRTAGTGEAALRLRQETQLVSQGLQGAVAMLVTGGTVTAVGSQQQLHDELAVLSQLLGMGVDHHAVPGLFGAGSEAAATIIFHRSQQQVGH